LQDQSTGEADFFSKRQAFMMLKHRCAALLIFTMLKHRCAALLIFTMLKHRCATADFHTAESPLFRIFHFTPKTLQPAIFSLSFCRNNSVQHLFRLSPFCC
jgi:hypothetical protein